VFDSSVVFLFFFVVTGLVALVISVRKLCRKEFSVIHKKLDVIIDAYNINYPSELIVSKRVIGLIIEGREEEAQITLLKETACSEENANRYINSIKENLTKR